MSPSQPRLVTGVILAAGSGSRMGGVTKQLLLIDGKPILQHVIDQACESSLDDIVLIAGYDAEAVLAAVDLRRARVVVNEHFLEGLSSSLITGISALHPETSGVLVLLGDQPGVTTGSIDRILEAYRVEGNLAVVPRYRGRRGNPVLIDRALFEEVHELQGDIGARAILRRHESDLRFVDFEYLPPPDVDTAADYEGITSMGDQDR